MSAKILPAIVVGLLLGTTAIASAQIGRHYYYMPAFEDPYYGTPFENVAPYTAYGQPDPYTGTVWDNVAPYTSR